MNENITVTMPLKDYDELREKLSTEIHRHREFVNALFRELAENQVWVFGNPRDQEIIEAIRRGRK